MMKRVRYLPVMSITVSAVALLFGAGANADWPFFYEADLVAEIQVQKRDIDLQEERLYEDEWRTGIEIRQRGYWVDPRIVEFVYTLQPSHSSRQSSPDREVDADLWNYSIGIDILQGAMTPVEVSLNSFLANNDFKATLSGSSKSRVSQNSALLRWKFKPFPMDFSITERDNYRKSSSVFSQSTIERDDMYRTFRIRGQSSKLSLLLEHESREDQLAGSNQNQERENANLYHRFAWGRGSHMNSRLEYRRRTDTQEFTTSAFTQDIEVRHAENVHSRLNYRLDYASGVFDTRNWDTRYTFNHKLYHNLASSVFLFAGDQRSQSTHFDELGGGAAVYYRKEFSGTRVGLDLSYSHSLFDRTSRQGFIEIIDEAYEISPDGRVILANRFVQQGSVVITDPTGSNVYLEGIDYEILTFANGLVFVSVIPGADLDFGQSILISYVAAVQPSGEFTQTEGTYNISISRGGFAFSHYALRTDAELIEGFLSEELQDRRQTITRFDYSWNTRRAAFQLSAGTDLWQDRSLKITSQTLAGSASIAIQESVNMSLALSRQDSFTVGRDGINGGGESGNDLDTVFTTVRLGLDWRVSASFTIRPSILAWRRSHAYREDVVRSFEENIIGAEIDFDYRFRKFSANLRVFYNDWQIRRAAPDSDFFRTDDGFRLSIRRSF